jgi:hypothetical protein
LRAPVDGEARNGVDADWGSWLGVSLVKQINCQHIGPEDTENIERNHSNHVPAMQCTAATSGSASLFFSESSVPSVPLCCVEALVGVGLRP